MKYINFKTGSKVFRLSSDSPTRILPLSSPFPSDFTYQTAKISRFSLSRLFFRLAAMTGFLPCSVNTFAVSYLMPELAPVMTVYFPVPRRIFKLQLWEFMDTIGYIGS